MSTKTAVAVLALSLILVAQDGFAQRTLPETPLFLNLDFARYRNNDSSGYVEVYYGFHPKLFTFAQRDGKQIGLLKVTTRIEDAQAKSYYVNKRSIVPVTVSDSNKSVLGSVLISQTGYALPFGDYRLDVLVADSLAPSRTDSISYPFSLKKEGPSIWSSDLELCSDITNSDKKEELYYKNSLEVIPNPTLVFGASSYPMMFNYSEYYNLDPSVTYKVKTQIIGDDGRVVKETSKARKYGVKNAVEAGTTNVASIPSGKYHVRLILEDENGKEAARTEKAFYIYNPHIKSAAPTASLIKGSVLAGMTADELADEFDKAHYIATSQEIRTFSQIKSAEGRREFLSRFWSEVEAGRLGQPGMLRSEYLQRVAAANQRFHGLGGRAGWLTDRGRVLILFAEPDEIERFPSSQAGKPYEIWHYYSIENGVEFDFVDKSGFGDYTLVNSTKRGELQDPDWQRYIQ